MVPWIINHASVLKKEGFIAIKLKTALFGFKISLPAWIFKYIKLYYLWVIMVFTYETNAGKFYTSFIFFAKERFFHIVNRPIIVIKPNTSVE